LARTARRNGVFSRELLRRNGRRTWQPHYDPRIGDTFRASMPEKDMDLWHFYDAIGCPTLVIRGAQSDLLARGTPSKCAAAGRGRNWSRFPASGTRPRSFNPEQIGTVRDFLLQGETP